MTTKNYDDALTSLDRIANKDSRLKVAYQTIVFNRAVELFHNSFGIDNEYSPKAEIDQKDFLLRHRLMKEENDEYLQASKDGDLVEIADALGDMLYILCGTILKHGMQDKIEAIFTEIQRSNMSKLDSNGNPIYRSDGKILKSDLYFKPDLKSILSDD